MYLLKNSVLMMPFFAFLSLNNGFKWLMLTLFQNKKVLARKTAKNSAEKSL